MCKCKKNYLDELMGDVDTTKKCKSFDCCIMKSKKICKKVDNCISNSTKICQKVDNCIMNSSVICQKVDNCIENSTAICVKIAECIQQQDNDFCKNPLFISKCIPFSLSTNPILAQKMQNFMTTITNQLNSCSTTLFDCIKSGDYSPLLPYIPSGQTLNIYFNINTLLFTNGTPQPLPQDVISSTSKPWEMQLNLGSYVPPAISLSSNNKLMNNVMKANASSSSQSVAVSAPTETTETVTSYSTTTSIGTVTIWIIEPTDT